MLLTISSKHYNCQVKLRIYRFEHGNHASCLLSLRLLNINKNYIHLMKPRHIRHTDLTENALKSVFSNSHYSHR